MPLHFHPDKPISDSNPNDFGVTLPSSTLINAAHCPLTPWHETYGIAANATRHSTTLEHCTLKYTTDQTWIFGQVTLHRHVRLDFSHLTYLAYQAIFNLIQTQKNCQIVRYWNYIPNINKIENNEERYQQFNIGRRKALLEYAQTTTFGAPAACALGLGDTLTVYFLAGIQPWINIENPRQLSAHLYPKQYGKTAPNFSRSALLCQPHGAMLFISGTASIVGHQSQHLDNIDAQTDETIVNLQSILDHANLKTPATPWSMADLYCRAYLRHPNQLHAVAERMYQAGIRQANFVHADICRRELIVEIEATAWHKT